MLQDREAADAPGERPVPPAEPKHKRRTRAQMREAAVAAKAAELQDTTPKTEATDSEHKLAPSTLQSPICKLPMSLRADRNEHPQPPAILPVPSAAYLQQTLIPSMTLSNPRPLLIILDLNGALIYRAFRSAPKTFTSRPFVPQFLAACLSAYYVLIWSSARPENVRRIVQGLLPEVELRALQERRPGRHLLGIWGRDTLGLTAWEYNNKVQVYKRLETVWGDRFINAPRGLGDEELIPRWDQSNTVLVDDSDVKASAQPYNLIQVSAFAGEPEPEDNSVLSQVLGYVEALNCQSDVSSFMRERPFKMKAQQVDSKVPVA